MSREESLRDVIAWLARKRSYWMMEAHKHAHTIHRGRLSPGLLENQRRCLSDCVAFARLFNRRVMLARQELSELQRPAGAGSTAAAGSAAVSLH